MMMDYKIIEQKEILHEAFAELLASLYRLGKIDDIAKAKQRNDFLNEARYVWNHLLTDEYSTMDDIIKLQGKYKCIKSWINETSVLYE